MNDIGNLEIHVAHSCNLTCESCSHYSNQGHKGLLDLDEAERWIRLWVGRVTPRTFSLVGGEPTIHPQLPKFVELAKRHWPQTHLRLVTNGFFLHRHPDLPRVLRDHGLGRISLSVHHTAPDYLAKLKPIFLLLAAWRDEYALKFNITHSFANWTRRYHGFGAAMQPFADGQPRQSWQHCPARYCRQLFEGRIWKCAPLAYLKMQDAKYGLGPAWSPYLQYQPLAPDCTDAELAAFFERQDEPFCGMCPAHPQKFVLPLPLVSPLT